MDSYIIKQMLSQKGYEVSIEVINDYIEECKFIEDDVDLDTFVENFIICEFED